MKATTRRSFWLVASVALCLVGLSFDIVGYPLLDPDEGRNAEVAREMAESNDFILPQLNAVPYLDKPVLFFATTALAIKALGPTVLAARLSPLLFTFATLFVVWGLGKKWFGTDGAWIATIATAASPFTIAYARTVIFDSTLTFFVVLSLAAFYQAIRLDGRSSKHPEGQRTEPSEGETTRRHVRAEWWSTLAWTAIALGCLTKGPIALGLPLIIALPFAAWRHRWRAVLDPLGMVLCGAIVAPWVLAISHRVPEFVRYAIVTETVARFATHALGRTEPFWYFLLIFPAAALPWSVICLSGLWKRRRELRPDPRLVFLLLWIVVPLVFFTLSQSKRPQYVLPLIPAVGLLVAWLWSVRRERYPGAQTAATVLGATGFALLLGSGSIASLVPASAGTAAEIPRTAILLGTICVIAGAIGWLGRARRGPLLVAFSLPIAAIPVVGQRLMDEIGNDRSAYALAQAVQPFMDADARVVAIQAYPLSLPFYLRQPLVLATADGSELTSNYLVRRFEAWSDRGFLRPRDWWREALLTCARPTVFITRADDDATKRVLQAGLDLLASTRKYTAYGPCGSAALAQAGR